MPSIYQVLIEATVGARAGELEAPGKNPCSHGAYVQGRQATNQITIPMIQYVRRWGDVK